MPIDFIGKEPLYPQFDARNPQDAVLIGGPGNHLNGVGDRCKEKLATINEAVTGVIGRLEGGTILTVKVWLEAVSSRLDPPRDGGLQSLPMAIADAVALKDEVTCNLFWLETTVAETNEIGADLAREFEFMRFVERGNAEHVWP